MKKKIIIAVFGAPGSGKSTLRNSLYQKILFWPGINNENVQSFAMGDLIRREVAVNPEFGKRVKTYTDRGLLVPIEDWIPLMKKAFRREDILITVVDGYLRNQAAADFFISETSDFATFVIKRETSLDTCLDWAAHRRFCKLCHAPCPDTQTCCPACGGELVIRHDEHNIKARIDEYQKEFAPVWPLLQKHYGRCAITIPDGVEVDDASLVLHYIEKLL